MRNKVLVLGINPSTKKKCQSLVRLNRWMDDIDVDHFSFSNIITESGVYNKSKIDYNWINELCQGYDKIVCLGGFVSSALLYIDLPHHRLPHPSPLNRRLNDKVYEREQLDLLKEYLWS
jgi:hypothetical protein